MASFKLGLCLIVSIFAFHLLPTSVVCDEEERNLLHDINVYRKLLNLPVLEENKKASCLAGEIADDLGDTHCEDFRNYYPAPGNNTQIHNFKSSVEKCDININSTKDGVVMPVCVPKLEPDAVFSNFTKSDPYTKYLNNSKYRIAGIGSEEDWMVLIISTGSASPGDFSPSSSAATCLLAQAWKGHFLVFAFFFTVLIFWVK